MAHEPEMILDLRYVEWDKKLWERFIKRIKKRVSLADCTEMGVLCIRSLEDRSSFEVQVIVKGFLSDYLDKYRPFEASICNVGKQRVKLPLVTEIESNTYLFYCTRLAVLKTNPNAANKILSYFLNLRLFYNEEYVNFLFFDEDMEHMLILENKDYRDIDRNEGVLDFIRKRLCEEAYVNIHLDEFYVSQKDYYEKYHYVHENFIYGFDDEKQVFYAYGMTKRQQTAEFVISYKEFLTAYEKGKLFYFSGAGYLDQEGYYPITINRIPDIGACEFTEKIFTEKIFDYLNPPENEREGGDIHVYGKNVYDWIVQDLMGEQVRNIVDYRLLHLLYEHKCCIRDRLEYLQQIGQLSKIGQKVYFEMEDIVNDFQNIRLRYLKQLRREEKLNFMNKVVENPDVKKFIAEQIRKSIEKEEKILMQMYTGCV